MEIWKFLHILSMFAAVTLLVGGSLFYERIVHSRDVAAIRRFAKVLKPLENLGIGLVILGIVFGLVTVAVANFDYTQGWLVIAYVLVGLLFVLGPIESASLAKVATAAEASPLDAPSPELVAAIQNRGRIVLQVVSTLLYVVIIFDMVVKPFS